jgi:trans-2,3-dihydro-3-hydroxyanthranilate isomerase
MHNFQMQLRFRILNVFTADGAKLSGNPLAVVEDGSGLDAAQMQTLARQFNLSETTYILPSKRAAALVRIFTPSYEMPFAGHPTLGTAHVCRSLGLGGDQLGLEMRAGIIPVTANGDHWTLRAAAATSRIVDLPAAEMARLLGLEANDIGFQPLWVKAGREQLVIPLTSEAAVRRVRPKSEFFEKIKSADGAGQAYVFASMGAKKILSRFFFPDGAAILEDPATGSACANLGAWFIAMGRRPPLDFEIRQGEFIGRPSILQLEVNTDNEVFVGGDVIEIGSGQLNL